MKHYAKRMTLDDRRIIERMYKDGVLVKKIDPFGIMPGGAFFAFGTKQG